MSAWLRHDEPMRVYLPLLASDLEALGAGRSLSLDARSAVATTPEFAVTVESDEPDELDLIAALAASDLSSGGAVAVLECDALVVDAELGEVSVSGDFSLFDFECLLTADVESQEVSWFGVQELTELRQALGKTAG